MYLLFGVCFGVVGLCVVIEHRALHITLKNFGTVYEKLICSFPCDPLLSLPLPVMIYRESQPIPLVTESVLLFSCPGRVTITAETPDR